MGTLFFISCQNDKEIHILLFNENQKELLKNYILIKKYDMKILDNDTYLTLNKINEKIFRYSWHIISKNRYIKGQYCQCKYNKNR
jgi:hypothetical protein